MNYRVFILPFSLLVLSVTSFADSATPKSTYDWAGVYVGGFLGGASGTSTNTQGPLDADGNGGFSQANAYSYDTVVVKFYRWWY